MSPAVVVLKVGGEVVASPQMTTVAAGLVRLQREGRRLVLVHGGGPQLSALQQRLQIPVRQIAGRRFTDEATLEAMKMAVVGQVNVDLCAALRRAGLQPVGLHGAVLARRRPPRVYPGAGDEPLDLGLVGDVVGFDMRLLHLLWQDGRVPVLACLGVGPDALYNINADTVACALAEALQADQLVLVSDLPLLADRTDPHSRIPHLQAQQAQELLHSGAVQGGMLAKLEEACRALAQGVREVLLTTDLGDNTTRLTP
ncbi:MAG: acetylglutamate kinase [Myxococcales bacterium]|nr:acetylglutamate kinase [Myxococcota bacterium]MDW8280991.1 acetylglutamate kinase [Myxococcales bacterium]